MDINSTKCEDETLRVTITDCRRAGFCAKGIKEACGLLGLDFRELVKSGLRVSDLREIDDVNVQRLVRLAERRDGADGR